MNAQIILRQPDGVALILGTPRARQWEVVLVDIRIHGAYAINGWTVSGGHLLRGRRGRRVARRVLCVEFAIVIGYGIHLMKVAKVMAMALTVATMVDD